MNRILNHKSFICGITLSVILTTTPGKASDLEYKPLSVGGLQEMGMINDGIVGGGEVIPIDNEWVDHFGAFMTQEATWKKRFLLQVGLGGIFQFPKEEKVEKSIFGSQYKLFYIGPSIAKGTYSFGPLENPGLKIGMGMFPFKYNRDAPNLGEYLFRSGPYPTYTMTGGFATIDNATSYIQGVHGTVYLENLKFDLLLTTETSLPPFYDFSLTGLMEYNLAGGLVTLGAGVQFKNLISVDSEKTTPKTQENGYFELAGTWYTMDPGYYTNQQAYWQSLVTESEEIAALQRISGDTTAASNQDLMTEEYNQQNQLVQDQLNTMQGIVSQKDSLETFINSSTSPGGEPGATAALAALPVYDYYSTAGTLLMGRAALDIKKIIPSDLFGEKDLKLYGEIALLGVENYPIYFENRSERMPFMIGFNIPGFKILDLISVQYEVFNSPYANNFFNLAEGRATPITPEGSITEYSERSYNDVTTRDNISWSVLISKQLLPGLTFSTQFARDHLRTVSTGVFFGARLEPNEVLYHSKSWYWMSQLSWSM